MGTLIEKALSQYGIIEVPGVEDNPEIMKYFDEIGQDWVKHDETSWCSAYVNWVAKTCGYEYSGLLTARSWLDVGELVLDFEVGDIVVLWRENPDSWKGHVGFPLRRNDKHIWVLGGNQSNMVRVSTYPVSRILGYRRLRKL